MMIDQELFDLCKQVYKATGWPQELNISQLYEYWDDHDELCVISIEDSDDELVPSYTSDYLLEKLPLEKGNYIGLQIWSGGNWGASWQPSRGKRHTSAVDDTPLKALLKLVLKLHEKELI